MHCSCIRDRYDFHTTPYKEVIIYQDYSDWIIDEYHSYPESYVVDITLPESGKVRLALKPNDIIKAEQLGLVKIKDGIYCFEIVDCGGETFDGCCGIIHKRFKLLAPFTECCIANSYATLDRYSETKDIEEMLRQAQVSVELNMLKEAREQFAYVKKKLKYLNCNC